MNVTLIGAGNMGAALACAIDSAANKVKVANPSTHKLEALKALHPAIEVFTSNTEAALGADVIILAVKPWVLPAVVTELQRELKACSAVVSVVAGTEASALAQMIGDDAPACYYLIPNTAVAVGQGMSFISSYSSTPQIDSAISDLLAPTGKVMFVNPSQMTAGMAVASCGIAYAMRYIRAAAQGGVELGLQPAVATQAIAQTLRGAAELLEQRGLHPEQEIDRVTTPGGITIKGLNAMEAAGFSAAVVAGIKASKP